MIPCRPLLVVWLAASAAVSLSGARAYAATPVDTAIQQKVQALREGANPNVAGVPLSSVSILPLLYERREWTPAWNNEKALALIALIRTTPEHGLRTRDYHLAELESMLARLEGAEVDADLRASFDLLLSDALIRGAYHSNFGKVDPKALDPHWNLEKQLDAEATDPAAEIQRMIDASDLREAFLEGVTNRELFAASRRGLIRYRAIQEVGGWPSVASGPVLRPGDEGERVVALRRRLAVTGDLAADQTTSPIFDETLEEAVRRFQWRHHLDVDGIVGRGTLEATNVPVQERIDQIRVNLERLRWVLHGLRAEFVLVDIAGFQAHYYRDDELIWSSRVQVGRPFRRTPVFRDEIEYLEINPTWTVPPGILGKDVLPAIRADRSYLARNEMDVVDHRSGRKVDPASIDWQAVTAARFPYRIVQRPGPRNALGRIKFMFPNPHLVFLHDTPSRGLFERTDRAFSSGCIRVAKPFELAELLLRDPARWNLEQVVAAVNSKETRRVNLPERVPVILLYWTVSFEEDGAVRFKKDLYNRDAPILEALDADFRFHQHHVDKRGPL
jgi:murein L,D-transpeptidase YcbB/YkuD